MQFNLVSIGEIIIALGLSLKAEQFGGIVIPVSFKFGTFFIDKKQIKFPYFNFGCQ